MKIAIETLGCPKNVNDSRRVMGLLNDSGHEIVQNPSEAEAIIVNTCGFINDAKIESIDVIFSMAGYEDKILVVSGCLTQRYPEELFNEIPEIDILLGVNNYDELPKLLEDAELHRGKRQIAVSSETGDSEIGRMCLDAGQFSATVKISEGCNHRCAYCIIPSIRGGYRERPVEVILDEVRELAAKGIKEAILIAQDVTAYNDLPRLLREMVKIDGIEWIRLMYCYEEKITDELIEVIASEGKICSYIDIPIQHASDKILRSMNRASTKKSIYRTIEKLRARIPDIAIRTTLIVGFPGETEEDFNELYDFVEDMEFDRLGVFPYSKEEGTVAYDMDDQVPEEVKLRRLDAIMMKQNEIALKNNRKMIGKNLEVIVERQDEEGAYIGRTRYDAPEIDNSVIFQSEKTLNPGDIVGVLIEDAFDYDLVGRVL